MVAAANAPSSRENLLFLEGAGMQLGEHLCYLLISNFTG